MLLSYYKCFKYNQLCNCYIQELSVSWFAFWLWQTLICTNHKVVLPSLSVKYWDLRHLTMARRYDIARTHSQHLFSLLKNEYLWHCQKSTCFQCSLHTKDENRTNLVEYDMNREVLSAKKFNSRIQSYIKASVKIYLDSGFQPRAELMPQSARQPTLG